MVFDRGRADSDVTERQLLTEAAGRPRADHNLKAGHPLDQVLRLHRELGLSMAADSEQQAELVDQVAVKPPQS